MLGFLFNCLLLLMRDYKFVGDGIPDWSLVIVVILFFVGAEIANHYDNKNK